LPVETHTALSAAGAPARAPRATGRARFAFCLAGIALIAVHVWMSLHLPGKGPFGLPDEAGYLGNATFLVHGYGRSVFGYSGGYSLLLVPAALLRSSPHEYYQAALLTNAVFAPLSAVLAYLLVRELFPDVTTTGAALVAGTVALQPFLFTIAQLAMSENALIPTTLLAALLLAKYAKNRSIGVGLAGGLVASFAFWISPRGILVAGAFGLALLVVRPRSRERVAALLAITVAMGACVAVGFVFNEKLRGGEKVPGVQSVSTMPPFGRLSTWRDLVAGVGARLGYLGAASLGLALIGFCVAAVWALEHPNAKEPKDGQARAVVGVFASVSVVTTLVFSTLVTKVGRIDHLYFGRYIEGVAMPLVAIGGGWLVSRSASRAGRHKVVLTAAGTTVAIAAFLSLAGLFPNPPAISTEISINVTALVAIRSLAGVHGLNAPVLVGGLVVGAVLLFRLIDSRLTLVAMVVLFAVGAYSIDNDYVRVASLVWGSHSAVAASLVRLQQAGLTDRCIRYEADSSVWALGNDSYQMPKWKLKPARRKQPASCRALMLTPGHRPTAAAGDWRLVSSETFVESALWVDLSDLPPQVRSRVAAVVLPTPRS